MEHLNLKIDGMSCGHCVGAVSSALKKVEGVNVESVAVGSAALEYDPSTTTLEQIRDAVAGAGFQVTS